MRNILLACLFLIPSFALAVSPDASPVVRRDDGGAIVEWRAALPTRWRGVYPYHVATWRHAADGWDVPSQAEIDAKAAADAAAAAEAEAQASLPMQAATGVAVQDEFGHWVLLEPTGDGLPVIGMQVSNSPLTPEEKEVMKAERKAAHEALKAQAADNKLSDKEKIALLMEAVFGIAPEEKK